MLYASDYDCCCCSCFSSFRSCFSSYCCSCFANAPTKRETVFTRHCEDKELSRKFIEKKWHVEEHVDVNSYVTWAVSTTSRSTVLLLAVGQQTMFTRNTYSHDERNPWLIFQHAVYNRALAEHITQQWKQMQVPNGQRERVDQIAEHIVYECKRVACAKKFILRPLECDGNGNVRVRIKDLTIWSHPPRDEPLIRVLEENFQNFKQKKGNLCAAAEGVNKILNNTNIPKDKRAINLECQRAKVRQIFNEYYQFYRDVEKDNLIPTSYQFPTLQLEITPPEEQGATPDEEGPLLAGNNPDRYGGTYSGIHNANDSVVHHKFPAVSKTKPRKLPSEETVFNDLLKKFGLNYAELFQGHDQ